ncbi:MAG: hypothetical protein NT006_07470 [Candidatus Aminicenantes bacterium]|nr:hypothetical protein [Candidatus Aminicenantes bacterium]
MFCNLTRWLISRAEDRGKKMPRFAERHAAQCGACREYARFTTSLSARLSTETPEFLAKAPDSPWDPAAWAAEGAGRGTRAPLRRRFVLHPYPAAAAVLVVAASALVFFLVVRPGPGPGLTSAEKQEVIASLKSVTAVPAEFRGAIAEAESSLAKERLILENSVLSAVEYFQTRLNIRIERTKEAPKSL